MADLWAAKPAVQQSMRYFFDRAPDPSNITYGHPYRRDVSIYRVDQFLAERSLGGRAGAKQGARALWRFFRGDKAAKLRDRLLGPSFPMRGKPPMLLRKPSIYGSKAWKCSFFASTRAPFPENPKPSTLFVLYFFAGVLPGLLHNPKPKTLNLICALLLCRRTRSVTIPYVRSLHPASPSSPASFIPLLIDPKPRIGYEEETGTSYPKP